MEKTNENSKVYKYSDLWRIEVICVWVITSLFIRIIYEFIKAK